MAVRGEERVIALLAGAALAGDLPVGLPVGPDRYAYSTLTTAWSATTSTATKRCWSRGPLALCLEERASEGRSALDLVAAVKAETHVVECVDAGTVASPRTAQARCHTRDGLQDQDRYWATVVDGPYAVVASLVATAVDAEATADATRFFEKFDVRSPAGSTTLSNPTCKALADGLAASADRFAGVRGDARPFPPGAFATTLTWPNAKDVAIVEKDGTASLYVKLLGSASPDATIAATQVFLKDLGSCDVWCAEMIPTESATPTRREILYAPRPDPALAPRCSTTAARVVLQDNSLDLSEGDKFTLALWLDAK